MPLGYLSVPGRSPNTVALDQAQYSSFGVREHTAELASWALNTQNFSRSDTQYGKSTSLSLEHGYRRDNRSSTRHDALNASKQDITGLSLPRPIKEVSEPVTPVALSSPGSNSPTNARSPSTSALTDMLQTSFDKLKQKTATARGTTDAKKKNGVNAAGDLHIPKVVIGDDGVEQADEETPLLNQSEPQKATSSDAHRDFIDMEGQTARARKHNLLREIYATARRRTRRTCHTLLTPKSWNRKALWEKGIKEPIGLLPCVFLGVLLNVLDALSYGQCGFCTTASTRADYT